MWVVSGEPGTTLQEKRNPTDSVLYTQYSMSQSSLCSGTALSLKGKLPARRVGSRTIPKPRRDGRVNIRSSQAVDSSWTEDTLRV